MVKRHYLNLLFLFGGAIWTLSGCTVATDLFFEPPPVTPEALLSTRPATETSVPVPSDTPLPPTPFPCAYAWANKDLPDDTAVLQEALKKANLGVVEAALSAYGENCVDTSTDTIVRFSAIQTDFFFSIPVKDINNRREKGDWAEKILRVVAQFPPGKVPGTNPGYIALVYSDGKNETRLWFQVEAGMRALDIGLSGDALYDALSPPS
jgi:hypothetical protein